MRKKEIKHIDIEKIENPSFLKDLNYDELDVLSDDIRDFILKVTSKNGGHLSSNLGVVDATIALCRSFDFSKDKIIFDVGHQCYTYKILTGRPLTNFRNKGGISGFQKMSESPYDHFEAGHSSTSISVACGLAYARDLNKQNYNVISFIGDSSIANGLAIEGLNNGSLNNHKMIIVLNSNDMSISQPVGALSNMFRKFSTSDFYRKSKKLYKKLFIWNRIGRKFLEISSLIKNWIKRHVIRMSLFDNLGYSVIGPIDGHDIKKMEVAFNKAKKSSKSCVVIIKTIKGKGYSYAENDKIGSWHGVSTFDIATGKFPQDKHTSWSEFYECLLMKKMEENKNIVTVVAATGLGSYMDKIYQKYPKRFIDVGIAEEHAVTMSSAISISGYHPVISLYSTFLQRAYDQISHDLARMNANSTILVDRAGLVGKDGETHQGLYDEAFLMSIPNVTIAMAASKSEAELLFNESFNKHGPFFIRYPRENFIDTNENLTPIKYGKWREIMSGGDTCVVSVGPSGIELTRYLKAHNINATLVDAVYQKPMDNDYINKLLNYKKVIIYDPYAIEDGFAHSLASKLMEKSYQGKLIIKSVPNCFIKQATINEQRQDLKLTIEDIASLI